jgi:hypothetical protein
MSRSRNRALGLLAGASCLAFAIGSASAASAAVTPGWECVPTAAGQAVVSGGVGAAPSCGASTTPVLAPTYVASGVGGKHTVQFSAVNLQIVDGGGTTSTINGTGNLVIGYAENSTNRARTGSHDLILGTANGWTSYADLVAGFNNAASNSFAATFGASNVASGQYSTVAGHFNTASASFTSVLGGAFNTAAAQHASVTGGEFNRAASQFSAIAGGCGGLTGPGNAQNPSCASTGYEAVSGGVSNRANGPGNVVSAGDFNTANGNQSSIGGGENNTVSSFFNTVAGGQSNTASGGQGVAIAGGLSETLTVDQNTQAGSSVFTP